MEDTLPFFQMSSSIFATVQFLSVYDCVVAAVTPERFLKYGAFYQKHRLSSDSAVAAVRVCVCRQQGGAVILRIEKNHVKAAPAAAPVAALAATGATCLPRHGPIAALLHKSY